MDKSLYPADWSDTIRPSILKRDGYKCSDCSIPHRSRVYKTSQGKYIRVDDLMEAWAKEQGKKVFILYLNVAHLDQNKANNEPSNLLSKCPRCHSRYDAPFKSAKRKMLLAPVIPSVVSSGVKGSVISRELHMDIRRLIRDDTGVNITKQTAVELIILITNNQ